jgi:hypothetical protein
VPASGDNEEDCGEADGMYRLAGETEVLGENLPQRHFCPSQNPTWPHPLSTCNYTELPQLQDCHSTQLMITLSNTMDAHEELSKNSLAADLPWLMTNSELLPELNVFFLI